MVKKFVKTSMEPERNARNALILRIVEELGEASCRDVVAAMTAEQISRGSVQDVAEKLGGLKRCGRLRVRRLDLQSADPYTYNLYSLPGDRPAARRLAGLLTYDRFPQSLVPPVERPERWLQSLRAGESVVEVRANMQSSGLGRDGLVHYGRTLGQFLVERVTPTGRVHVGGWIFKDGHQYGAYGPGCAAIYPLPEKLR